MTTVTVVIPTYKRAKILPIMLSALKSQTFKDFDVIMVVKPSGDGTEELLKQASNSLKITVIPQQSGHIVDAYFLGAKNSTGDIVAFLDDDAIPAQDWLMETVKIFQNSNVVGVTGDQFPVVINGGKLHVLEEPEISSVLSHYEFALWGRPLTGLENYKNSIGTSGIVYERGNNAYSRKHGEAKALLRGPSMAVKGEVLRGFSLPPDWILGCAWEMMLGWQIWKQGYVTVYSPKVKVYHIVHGRTSSRDFLNPRTDLLWAVEAEMLFYRLYGAEPEFSLLRKLVSDVVRVVHGLKHLKENSRYYLRKIEGIFFGNVIGAKWVICKTFNVSYSPLVDLKRFQKASKVNASK
ncbi:MAG: glycosyltransferase family 2 protein [Candidatus Bathyarchaeia archaeon]|jgi:cellulose synthase/poly-beta-1,6-N-acetylglucosamine synthase-like glycosyltransferase